MYAVLRATRLDKRLAQAQKCLDDYIERSRRRGQLGEEQRRYEDRVLAELKFRRDILRDKRDRIHTRRARLARLARLARREEN